MDPDADHPAKAAGAPPAPERSGDQGTDPVGDQKPVETVRTPSPAGGWIRLGLLVLALVLLTKAAGFWGLVVVLGIVVMIFLHELGHYLMAKRSGMKVTEFFLGFGPRIWSFQRGETEYGLKLIPAGAYVKIIGMTNLEEVPYQDEGRTYRQKPFWARMGVAVAGSTMHFLQAIVIVWVALVFVGFPGGAMFTTAHTPGYWDVTGFSVHSAARQAGVAEGDHILAIDGERFRSVTDFQHYIEARPDQPVTLTVSHDGATRQVPLTVGANRQGEGQLGVTGPGNLVFPTERVGALSAVPQTFHELGAATVGSIEALGRFFSPSGLSDFADQLSSGGEPEPAQPPPDQAGQPRGEGPSPEASSSGENRLMSIYGVFQLGTSAAEHEGVGMLLGLFALINIFIGIFNLVPLLPFDGGHVAIAVYERIQELRYRRRRYFTDVGRLLPLTYVVVVVLAGIFATTLYLDIANPVVIK